MSKRHSVTPIDRKYIYQRDHGVCQICGAKITYAEMTVDHIHPLSLGGLNCRNNYQCTCRYCNQMKQDLYQQDFYEKVTEIFWYQTQQRCGSNFSKKLLALIKNP